MPDRPLITSAVLSAAGVRNPAPWTAPLSVACAANGITTPFRACGFLATILHESTRLTRLVESMDYSVAGLLATWPNRFTQADAEAMGRTDEYLADQFAIAEHAYGGRMGNGPEGQGDGWMCRGRGPLQVTGLDAYMAVAATAGTPLAAVASYLESPGGGSMTAARWWASHGCNELADRQDVRGFRVRVNGGTNGLAEVTALWGLLRRVVS